jgi:hypothetical protein
VADDTGVSFQVVPDPWRGWIGLRRLRRWTRATRFAARQNRAAGPQAPVFAFYPMRPEPNASISYVMRRLGARISFEPSEDAFNVAWDTGTWFSKSATSRLRPQTLNGACLDISKTTVDRAWADVAGYSIAVDPLATLGLMVVKPDENGRRGGRVVQGPLSARERHSVYQRLIDTRVGDRVLQIRPMILRGRIVLVYEKWRPHPQWFKGPELTIPKTVADFFTDVEAEQLIRFAAAIGLDYGELDVVRDAEDGRIYVVDANRTPVRPKGLPVESEDAAFGPQAEAFAALLKGALIKS